MAKYEYPLKNIPAVARDPWAKHEAWRAQYRGWTNYSRMFPGIGIGFGIFLVIWGYETLTAPKDGGHH